ncbi:hypothetical protein CW306_01150 [Bacillus sp. BA3]|nr:hypothetical protein CW306_01150 [Bacillus sp. BA3]
MDQPGSFYLKNVPGDWIGRCETPAGKACLGKTPQAEAEEAPQTAREKRVPEVEIKSTTKLHFLVGDVTIPEPLF